MCCVMIGGVTACGGVVTSGVINYDDMLRGQQLVWCSAAVIPPPPHNTKLSQSPARSQSESRLGVRAFCFSAAILAVWTAAPPALPFTRTSHVAAGTIIPNSNRGRGKTLI